MLGGSDYFHPDREKDHREREESPPWGGVAGKDYALNRQADGNRPWNRLKALLKWLGLE